MRTVASNHPARDPIPGTPLQAATVRLLGDLEDARAELADAAYDVLVDIAWRATKWSAGGSG